MGARQAILTGSAVPGTSTVIPAQDDYGAEAVRYLLLSAAVTTTLGALLFVWAAASIRGDIKRAE